MNIKQIVVFAVLAYMAYKLFGMSSELFHSGIGPYFRGPSFGSKFWWNPKNSPYTAHPYVTTPFPGYSGGVDPSEEAQGDLVLTNMYRKWHNLEGINRVGVLEHSHLKNPGGDESINRQFYVAEAMDREAMRMQKLIRDDVAFRRRPYTDAYPSKGAEHSPLGGNFYECHIGDCQWDHDTEGKIIGIPSVPGTRHSYY